VGTVERCLAFEAVVSRDNPSYNSFAPCCALFVHLMETGDVMALDRSAKSQTELARYRALKK
jgi:hypothetical protein